MTYYGIHYQLEVETSWKFRNIYRLPDRQSNHSPLYVPLNICINRSAMSIFQLKWNGAFLLVVNEGWALSLLPVSDANTDEAMGKMANVHPGHAFKNAPMPAAFVWALSQRSVGGFLAQNAQSCDMNCKVIGQSCSFLSVGHSSKGHPPSTANEAGTKSNLCTYHAFGKYT